ncbi:MAG: hypothetical protein M9939_24860 [Mesorhizobium sp.]|nr:hypothetical protein [Mesorhizobium sp.]MCO5164324.1 hypothetical protein [Mesorhizobium sp.]
MRLRAIATSAIVTLAFSNATYADAKLEEALTPYFDLDRNGLDQREKSAMIEHIKGLQARAVHTVEFERQEIKRSDDDWRYGLLLRDAYATGVFLDSKEGISDAGALFSYTKNFRSGGEVFAATGALMFGAVGELNRNFNGDYDVFRATRVGFLGGVEFDTKWVNGQRGGSLAARFGAELETAQGGLFPYQYWKMDGIYSTDFDGTADVFSLEARWMPISDVLPIGKTWSLDGGRSAWLYFRPTLNLDYTYVGDNGQYASLTPGSSYLWTGLKADIALFFTAGPLQRFSLNAKYIYMHNVIDDGSDSINYGQVAAKYVLNDSGSTFLQARYTYGNTPRTLQRKNEIYVGLTILFGDLNR